MNDTRIHLGFDKDGAPVYLDDEREYFFFNPTKAAYKAYADMKVGDVLCWMGQPRAEILRLADPYTDMFGRKMHAHWARALDGSGRGGYLPYGEGGQAPVET